ncbi:MAG: PaaI family thioesterase [Burkholderiaceae bacterium]
MSAARPDVPAGFTPWPALPGFVQVNGPLYERKAGGVYQCGFRVEERHCNPMQVCHGGMMATFCDMLLPLGVHALSEVAHGRFLPTVSLQIDYLAPAPLGAWVQGEAQLLRSTRAMVFAQGLVTADGVPAARTSGILKIGPPFDDPRLRRS